MRKKRSWPLIPALLFLVLAFSGCGAGSGGNASTAPTVSSAGETTPDYSDGGAGAVESPGGITDASPVKPEYDYGDITDDGLIGIPPVPGDASQEAGVLTAGEWSDNDNWEFYQTVLNTAPDWDLYQNRWKLYPAGRIAARVRADQQPVPDAAVTLFDGQGRALWTSVTDRAGNAYLFYGLFGDRQAQPAKIRVTAGQEQTEQPVSSQDLVAVFNLSQTHRTGQSLDLMLVFDTTGSMGDELSYLQRELENVVKQVRQANANIPTRVSVNFYRDHGDQYIVRPFPFTADLSETLERLRAQSASGGGDYPEAVEMALKNAIEDHDWAQGSTKLLFLILDAPPHNDTAIVAQMQEIVSQASARGIRIIPVASSGVDKETEFLLRAMASSTGGTYVFLTDDSGVGNSHLEPTIGNYTVQKLNRLLVEIINRYLQ